MTIIDFAAERAARRPDRYQLAAISQDFTPTQMDALITWLTERGWTVNVRTIPQEQPPCTP